MSILALIGSVEIGLFYAIVAMGVYLTFRVVNFSDLTVDGTFTLGAAVTMRLISMGYNPILACSIALIAGACAGLTTGILSLHWRMPVLLASILVLTSLYSINLRIMGKPNIALMHVYALGKIGTPLLCAAVVLAVLLLLYFFLTSQIGLALRAVGNSPRVAPAYGINVNAFKLSSLALSNAIIAFAGSFFALVQGFSDIGMGIGTLVAGLASVIIGEVIIGTQSIWHALLGCIAGSIIYRLLIGYALSVQFVGLQPSDVNIITTLFVLLMMKIKTLSGRSNS